MKKWIVRIITAIFAVCILTGMFYTGKGYVMFKDALKEVEELIAERDGQNEIGIS